MAGNQQAGTQPCCKLLFCFQWKLSFLRMEAAPADQRSLEKSMVKLVKALPTRAQAYVWCKIRSDDASAFELVVFQPQEKRIRES